MINVSLKNSDHHIYFDSLFVKFEKNLWPANLLDIYEYVKW